MVESSSGDYFSIVEPMVEYRLHLAQSSPCLSTSNPNGVWTSPKPNDRIMEWPFKCNTGRLIHLERAPCSARFTAKLALRLVLTNPRLAFSFYR
ncbi:hypothetical protein PoB_001425200 [Plakobranchus ocellatus]|uniref:Uncharacterized protein n=1 Tax=Plakobranchus ocellatus TaxID=259542 RepID=A0AAV3YZM3_9GAST|nr:hypothetical protein PoB_001425200 [Plakobranchus ocellatus]